MSKKSKSPPTTGTDNCATRTSAEQPTSLHRGNSKLVNGLDLWEAEAASAGSRTIPVVRIDENERLLILFTTCMARVLLHFLDSQILRDYLHCLGQDCLLCRIGRTVETRDLLPVYDLLERNVGVLPISPSLRPNALRPQLLPLLRRVGSEERPFLTTIKRAGTSNFIVTTASLPGGTEDGAAIIAQFEQGVNSGMIDLASAYQRIDNVALQEIPQITTAMKAKGIEPCSFELPSK